MARVLAVGSTFWSSHRMSTAALRQVMRLYREPYVLVCDMTDGAARSAAGAAHKLGWQVDAYEYDQAKCAADCPAEDGHRRSGGPDGSFCPSARYRNVNLMLDSGIDLCLAFTCPSIRDGGLRKGQHQARRRDIGVWTFEQRRKEDDGGDETG